MKAQHPSGELSMTWTVEFIEASGYVSVVTQGELTRENNQKLAADILSQDFWAPGLNVLLDHRKLCLSATTFEMVRQKVDNFKKHEKEIGGGKVPFSWTLIWVLPAAGNLKCSLRGRYLTKLKSLPMSFKPSSGLRKT